MKLGVYLESHFHQLANTNGRVHEFRTVRSMNSVTNAGYEILYQKSVESVKKLSLFLVWGLRIVLLNKKFKMC